MKPIALVSTYPPYKCGIAVYDKHIAQALRASTDAPIHVLSEGGEQHTDDIQVHDTYSRKGDYYTDILNQLEEIKPDVVHFQHAPDLFPNNERFISLLAEISRRGMRPWVTFHTVYENPRWRRFFAEMSPHSSIIVHNQLCKKAIAKSADTACRIEVIPHGTEPVELPDRAESKMKIGVPQDSFVFLFFGAIHVMKNLHTLVRAFRRVKKNNPNALLLVGGRPFRDRIYNQAYTIGCKALSGFTRKCIWHDSYIEDDMVQSYLGAADVLMLPYWQKYHSASGVLHMAMGSGLPVLCSDSPKFSEVGPPFPGSDRIVLPTHSATKWARAMGSMINDDKFRSGVSDALREHGRSSTWDAVGRMHLKAFSQI